MDGVLVPFTAALVRIFNRRHAKTHGLIGEHWLKYRIEDQFQGHISDLLYEIMHEPGFFAAIEPHEGAEDTLRELRVFADIEICTSPPVQSVGGKKMLNAYAAADKIGWLFRQFNDLDLASDVTLTLKKHKMRSDVLVDDSIDNVVPWCNEHPAGLGYLVARTWNEDVGPTTPPNMRRGHFSEAPLVVREWWSSRQPQDPVHQETSRG